MDKIKMFEHLEKEVVIRWDPLHLINRAHIEARGKLCQDGDDVDESENEDEEGDEVMQEEVVLQNVLIKELIDYNQNTAKKFQTGLEYALMKEISMGMFKRPKVWSSTRMVVYKFEMVERFLENSVHLDVPLKYLLLTKCHCLSMFALKIILKNVQMADVECSYVDEVVVKQSGKDAMILATQVAFDVFSGNPIDYLKTDEENIKKTNVSHPKSDPFALELFNYITNKEDLFTNTEKPHEKVTRAVNFSIQEAKKTCDDYINVL